MSEFSKKLESCRLATAELTPVLLDENMASDRPEQARRYPHPFEILWMRVRPDHSRTMFCFFNQMMSRAVYRQDVGDFHHHEYVEMIYVIQGSYRIDTGSEILSFEEQEFALIDPNMVHRDVYRDEPGEVLFLCMSESFFDELFLRQLEGSSHADLTGFISNALYNPKRKSGCLRLRSHHSQEEIEQLLFHLIREMEDHQGGYEYMIKGLITRVVNTLAPQIYQQLSTNEQQLYKKRLYEQVLDYMENHLADVTIEELSDVFHFQKDYFTRLIRQYGAVSFTETLKHMRIRKAAYFLQHTDMSISEIASRVGYQNESYFYRIFAESKGCSPASFRKRK